MELIKRPNVTKILASTVRGRDGQNEDNIRYKNAYKTHSK